MVDADGEFILIEAAEYLPKWANPETCEQRVSFFIVSLSIDVNNYELPPENLFCLLLSTNVSRFHSSIRKISMLMSLKLETLNLH